MNPSIVAIDGPAGSGKTTLARRLALALDVPHVNTGSTYRAVAREALRHGVSPDDARRLVELAGSIEFSISDSSAPPSLFVGGAPPGDELLSPDVEGIVSQVSRHQEVRAALRRVQRRLAEGGAVVEGRDIGTVVFPEATVKFFLRADPSERAARRLEERGVEDPELAEALARRDAMDAETNPFVPAEDAIVIETTGRDADEVFDEALAAVRRALDALDERR